MHIPDGFVTAPVAAGTWLAAGAVLAGGLATARRREEPAPATMLGSLAAFVFAAQMINVPVAPGTSGHLVGATLVALLVGPGRGMLVMAVVLAIQALLFQDGGITALGANVLDMGAAGCLVGWGVASLVSRGSDSPRARLAGAVLGAFLATLVGATLVALWLSLSGLYPLGGILPLVLVTHAAIGVLEAALTGAVLVVLLRWRPDLPAAGTASPAGERWFALAGTLLGVALLLAAFAAPFASSLPDGLEAVAERLGFAARERVVLPGPLADYGVPALARHAGLATAVAGVLGTALAAVLGWLIGRGLPGAGERIHR